MREGTYPTFFGVDRHWAHVTSAISWNMTMKLQQSPPPTPPQVWMTPTFLWAWNYYINAIPSTAKYSQTRRFVTCPIIQVWGKHFEGKSKHWKPWKSVGQHDARCHGAKTGIENQHFKTTKFTNLQVTLQQLCLEQFSKETNPKCSKDLAYWPSLGSFGDKCRCKYTIPIEHLGMFSKFFIWEGLARF